MHRMPRRLLALLATLLLVLAACGDDDDDTAAGDDTTTTTAAAADTTAPDDGSAGGAATVAVASSELGDILVDGEGRTLYMFGNDSGGDSSCYDACAQTWPALTTEGDASAGDGADASLLGTTERTDGSTQVTYNEHPLYRFASDQAPGDTNGQGVGDVWFVVSPAGEPIPA
jgi:predicted lipoprotein with Yx(FWY)xxD motif